MRTLDEQLAYDLGIARKNYQRSCKEIRDTAVKKHMSQALAERIKKAMPGMAVTAYNNSLTVHLTPDYNISKDWMVFMDENMEFIAMLGKGEEYKVEHNQEYGTYDYRWDEYQIDVWYGAGKCKRVKIGSTTETVTTDVYEVQCL